MKKSEIKTMNLQAAYQQLAATEQQLRASEQQLRANQIELEKALIESKFWAEIVLNANVGVAVGYPNGKLGASNKTYQELTGYTQEELNEIDWNNVLTPPEWLEIEMEKLNELHKTKRAVSYEKEYIQKNGRRIPVELTVHPGFDEKGNISKYYAFIIEITERKKRENELKTAFQQLQAANQQLAATEQQLRASNQQLAANEQQLRAANQQLSANEKELIKSKDTAEKYLNIAAEIIIALDVNGNITLLNDSGHELLGYEYGELDGEDWFAKCLPGGDADNIRKTVFNQMMKGHIKNVANYESDIRTKSGEIRTILWHNTVLKDEDGNFTGTLSSGEDITEQKKAEKELLKNQYYLTKAQEIGSIGSWELDINTNELIWTDQSYRNFGIPIGTKQTYELFLDSVHPEDRNYVDEEWKKAVEGQPYDIEHRIVVDNQVRWLREKAELTFDTRGNAVKAIGFTQDITERKIAESELKKIEWLLLPKGKKTKPEIPEYGDITELNQERTILDAVGKDVLHGIVSDYLSLLGTSAAIYEKNGDYAYGIFSSKWCRFMDTSSRALCQTRNNKKALESGKWLCHESCWLDASQQSMIQNQAMDIQCSGGLNIFAIPIKANNKVIGSINFGYGNPPADEKTLKEIAAKYKVSYEKLLSLAKSYETRPAFIIDIAKEKLETSAKLIGEIVERKMTKQALKASEERLKMVLNNSHFPVAVVDEKDQNVQFWSQNALKLFGHEPKTSEEWYELAYPDPKYRQDVINRWKPILDNIRSTNKTANTGEYKIHCKDGTVKICELFAQFIPGNLIVTFNDITEKKQIEEKINFLANLLEVVEQSIIVTDINGKIIYWNPFAEKLYGWSSEQVLDKNIFNITVPRISKQQAVEIMEKLNSGESWSGEFLVRDRDGRNFPVFITNSPIFDNKGKLTGIIGVSIDITERKQAEDKLKAAKEKLEESEDFLNRTGKISRVGGWQLTDNFSIVKWTKTTGDIHELPEGYYPLLEDAINYYHPDDRDKVNKCVTDAIEKCKPFDFKTRLITAKGNLRWVRAIGRPEIKNGKCVRLSGTFQDITKQKKAEEKLQESQASLLDAQRIANIGNWSLNLLTGQVEMSDEMLNIIGFEDRNKALDVSKHEKFYTPESWQRFNEALETARATGNSYEIEMEFSDKTAKFRYAVARGEATFDENSKITGLKGTLQDITERKEAEIALKESEMHLRSLIENPAGYVIYRTRYNRDIGQIKVIQLSPSFAEVLGLSEDEKDNFQKWFQHIHPADLPIILQANEEGMRPPFKLSAEIRYNHPTEGFKWFDIRSKGIPYEDDPNMIEYANGLILDITDRKKAEDRLQESENKLQTWIQNSQICTKMVDLDFNLQFMSDFGISELKIDDISKFYGKPYPFYFFPDRSKITLTENLKKVIETGKIFELDAELADTKGNKLWYHHNLIPVKDEKGKLDYILVVSADITKRKFAEEQTKKDLKEKNMLIQEIYHRTKNNMAVISAMLSLHSHRSENENLKTVFREIDNKIQAMSLVHQKLYMAKDLYNIDLEDYIQDLINLIIQSYGELSDRVKLRFDLQKVKISIDSAIPLGLIINELVSNIFKHAFPENLTGDIQIRLSKEKDKAIQLELIDNGVGFPENFDPRKDGSMGLVTVFAIAEKQLRGEISVLSENGLRWQIKIHDDLNKEQL